MKKLLIKTHALIIPTVTLLVLPHLVSAQIKFDIQPLIKFNTLEGLLLGLLGIFITVATPIIVIYIVYSGYLYVTARGNAQQVEQATRSLTYAIIGGVLIIGAVAITTIVGNTVGALVP